MSLTPHATSGMGWSTSGSSRCSSCSLVLLGVVGTAAGRRRAAEGSGEEPGEEPDGVCIKGLR
jgi:hypothetical protein